MPEQKGWGPARELLQAIVHSPDHILLLSPFLLQEVERVRSYERVRLIAKLTDEEIVEYLAFLRAEHVSEPVFPGPAPRIVPSDVNDDPVVYTAIADALCTLNRDFFHPQCVSIAASAVCWSQQMSKCFDCSEAKHDSRPEPCCLRSLDHTGMLSLHWLLHSHEISSWDRNQP